MKARTRTKVLLSAFGALLCTSLLMTATFAQQNDDEDVPDDEMPSAVIDGTVVTDGVPPIPGQIPMIDPATGQSVNASPIREHYGPSSLPSLPTVAQLIEGIAKAERTNDANDLVYAYGEAVRDPALARGALTRLMYDYYHMRVAAVTPEQAIQATGEAGLRFQVFQSAQLTAATQQSQKIIDQNDQIIKQNQQIIFLLQQIAARK